jgi:hypothetical protein
MAKKYTTCIMHAVSLSNLMDFSFLQKFLQNFCEILRKFSRKRNIKLLQYENLKRFLTFQFRFDNRFNVI